LLLYLENLPFKVILYSSCFYQLYVSSKDTFQNAYIIIHDDDGTWLEIIFEKDV
jgi:hypothetical protein